MSKGQLADILVRAVKVAGAEIYAIYENTNVNEITQKGDGSPLTSADLAAHMAIVKILRGAFPEIPILSEEAALPKINAKQFFLVDPLDGTKEFINRNGEFTVNIALIIEGFPVAGAIYLPVKQELFWADAGEAFYQKNNEIPQKLAVAKANKNTIRAVVSRSHKDEQTAKFLEKFTVTQEISAGSSLKFCLLAKGDADIYPRFGRTMEWDIAAGHAILEAAGGALRNVDGSLFAYQKKDYANDYGFIAWGDPELILS